MQTTNLILNPVAIANGQQTRHEITERLITAIQYSELQPIDVLQLCRSIEKAAADILKQQNSEGLSILDMAVEQALTLPEVQQIVAETRAFELAPTGEEKPCKTFTYNGCRYSFKESIVYSFADAEKFTDPECVEWREKVADFAELEKQISDLRLKQRVLRVTQEDLEQKYFRQHPDCEREIKQSISIL